MFRSYEVSSVNTIVWSFVVAVNYAHDWQLAMLTSVGVGLAVAFNPLTSYFTSTRKSPVKEIVKSTKTGPATTILSGLSVGMESSVWAVVVIAISFIVALALYSSAGALYVLYGVAMIGIGMLSHTGNNVAMDSYGPISDNANGIGEMAWHDQCDEETVKARQIMADLDAVGQHDQGHHQGRGHRLGGHRGGQPVRLVHHRRRAGPDPARHPERHDRRSGCPRPRSSSGCCSAAPCRGSSARCRIRAVTRAAGLIVEEVRRQFKHPGHHGRQGQAGLRPGRRDLDRRGPEGARAAGPDLGLHAAHRRPRPPGRGPGRLPGGHHPERPAPGRVHGQRGRRLGQRQEVHRGRAQGRHRLHRQGLGPSQGGRRRRHGRRSAQGHGRARRSTR